MANELLGYVAVVLAVILFGVFPITTKTSVTADGVFYQLCMCMGIYTVGCIVFIAQCMTEHNAGIDSNANTCPQLEPMAALGGVIWCLSNLLLCPLVNAWGVGLTMMTWGMSEMFAGWGTGRFGLFHLNKEPVASPNENTGAVVLALVSLLVLGLAQPAVADGTDKEAPDNGIGKGVDGLLSLESSESSRQALLLEAGQGQGRGPSDAVDGHDPAILVASSQSADSSGSSSSSGLVHRKTAAGSSVGVADVTAAAVSEAGGAATYKSAVDGDADFAANGYDFVRYLSPVQKRAFGFCGSILAGLLSGSTFTPVQAVIDATTDYQRSHPGSGAPGGPGWAGAPYPGASLTLLDHLFSHFSGIMVSSILFTVLYAAASSSSWGRPGRRKGSSTSSSSKASSSDSGDTAAVAAAAPPRGPWVSGPLVGPAYASGLIWGIAMVCWFTANANLEIVIAFPMVTVGPGIVNMIIGAVWFREVHGARNIALLCASTALYTAAAVLISISGGGS